MRNFSSTAAIIVALESEVIQCLSETHRELETQDKALLGRLSDFAKSKEAYIAALRSPEDPCVPRLGEGYTFSPKLKYSHEDQILRFRPSGSANCSPKLSSQQPENGQYDGMYRVSSSNARSDQVPDPGHHP